MSAGTPDMGVRAPAPAPAALAGFEMVRRYWDGNRDAWVAKILPGEYYVTRNAELVTTVLGSCVSACIRDRVQGIGGMNHFMLPDEARVGPSIAGAASAPTRYGAAAMEHLINAILNAGGRRCDLEVKVFGGGRVLKGLSDIGARNIGFVLEYVETEAIPLVGSDVGDSHPRRVLYEPRSGRAWVKRLRNLHNDTIARREASYRRTVVSQPVAGSVELF